MEEPLITVIIPAYNAEKYLSHALDSLLAQTLTEWEAICINDGSKDSTGDILNAYAERDKRIVVRHQENGGAARARNKALQMARGEFITMLDADDWLEPQALQELFSALRDTPGAALAVCNALRHTADGKAHLWANTHHGKLLRGEWAAHASVLKSLVVCSWGKLYRRSLIQQHGLHNRTGQQVGEDAYFLMCYLAHAEHIVFVPMSLYHYADSATSVVNTYYAGALPLNTYLENLSVPLYACEYAESHGVPATKRQEGSYYSYLWHNVLFTYAAAIRILSYHRHEYVAPVKQAFRDIRARLGNHLALTARVMISLRFWCEYGLNRIIGAVRFRLRLLFPQQQ